MQKKSGPFMNYLVDVIPEHILFEIFCQQIKVNKRNRQKCKSSKPEMDKLNELLP